MKTRHLVLICLSAIGYWLCFLASAQESPVPIRFSGDSAARYSPSLVDSNALSNSVSFVRGDYVTFDIGLFDRGVFRATNTVNQFATATLAIYTQQNDTNNPLMVQTITNNGSGIASGWNTNCTLAAWSNNAAGSFTNWNLEFDFTSPQTSITLNGQAAQGYWLRLYCQTTNATAGTVTYVEGPITVFDGPINSVALPAPAFYESILINGTYQLAIWDPVSAHFYTLEIDTVSGIRTLSLGDTPY